MSSNRTTITSVCVDLAHTVWATTILISLPMRGVNKELKKDTDEIIAQILESSQNRKPKKWNTADLSKQIPFNYLRSLKDVSEESLNKTIEYYFPKNTPPIVLRQNAMYTGEMFNGDLESTIKKLEEWGVIYTDGVRPGSTGLCVQDYHWANNKRNPTKSDFIHREERYLCFKEAASVANNEKHRRMFNQLNS